MARARNAESGKALETSAFASLERRILDILDSRARIPNVTKIARYYYNFWQDAKNPRGLWCRTTLDEYRKSEPLWERVLDLDALGIAEEESWVWQRAACLRPEHRRCLIALSRGGADANVVREFDLETKTFVDGGFVLPEAKSEVNWRDADSIYVGTDFGADTMTASGYPRIAKVCKRGTSVASAQTIYEGRAEDIMVVAYRDHTKGFERDFVERAITFFTNELFVLRDGKRIRIDKPDSATAVPYRDLLLIKLRDPWTIGGKKYAAGALLAVHFERFIAGERNFSVLFQPTARKALAGFSPTRNRIIVNELDNVRNRVVVLARADGKWTRTPLRGLPNLTTVVAKAVDADESDEYFATVTGFVEPTALFLGVAGGGPPTKLQELPAFFDARGLAVTQHEAVSKDGTRIPYFQVGRAGLAQDGSNPTVLYGYGGFEISEVPRYSRTVGAAWLEQRGVYVVANIRGGGEFGPRWHQAALKADRHKSYEDFIAVAEDLIRREVTSPQHLGIMGGSNGGLLVGNAMTMRPDLFGAVVCMVPLLDMRRYHLLLAGASWVAEYGNPDDPVEWAFMRAFSPYHNVRAGVRYPTCAVHHVDARRSRASGARPQDGRAHAGAGTGRAVLREHRRRTQRGGRQPAACAHVGAGVHVPCRQASMIAIALLHGAEALSRPQEPGQEASR